VQLKREWTEKNFRILLYNKSTIYICLIATVFYNGSLLAQVKRASIIDPDKIYAIEFTQTYITDSLKLNKGNGFYEFELDTASKPTPVSTKFYYYVYASLKSEQKSIFGDDAFKYFGHNDSLAYIYGDSLEKVGYDVMVYHTAATSGAQFVQRMLEYNPGSISFIMFHESIHRHKQNTKSNLPYIFEEALGDVTGIMFASKAVKSRASQKKHRKYITVNEKIYAYVYKAINDEISKEECTLKLKKFLVNGDLFQNDRFMYEVNNAFLLRYTSYIKYYFLLKDVYKHFGNKDLFYKAVFNLSGSEQEVAKKLEGYLIKPTLDF
jgi:hypothetical protein